MTGKANYISEERAKKLILGVIFDSFCVNWFYFLKAINYFLPTADINEPISVISEHRGHAQSKNQFLLISSRRLMFPIEFYM